MISGSGMPRSTRAEPWIPPGRTRRLRSPYCAAEHFTDRHQRGRSIQERHAEPLRSLALFSLAVVRALIGYHQAIQLQLHGDAHARSQLESEPGDFLERVAGAGCTVSVAGAGRFPLSARTPLPPSLPPSHGDRYRRNHRHAASRSSSKATSVSAVSILRGDRRCDQPNAGGSAARSPPKRFQCHRDRSAWNANVTWTTSTWSRRRQPDRRSHPGIPQRPLTPLTYTAPQTLPAGGSGDRACKQQYISGRFRKRRHHFHDCHQRAQL